MQGAEGNFPQGTCTVANRPLRSRTADTQYVCAACTTSDSASGVASTDANVSCWVSYLAYATDHGWVGWWDSHDTVGAATALLLAQESPAAEFTLRAHHPLVIRRSRQRRGLRRVVDVSTLPHPRLSMR